LFFKKRGKSSATELLKSLANKELVFKTKKKEKRATELVIG
jgi:hypothetical protein